jgi:hypothetical protein
MVQATTRSLAGHAGRVTDLTRSAIPRGMATLIFANGDQLPVTADTPEVLEYVEVAQGDGVTGLPRGWIVLTAAQGADQVTVQVAQIACIRA